MPNVEIFPAVDQPPELQTQNRSIPKSFSLPTRRGLPSPFTIAGVLQAEQIRETFGSPFYEKLSHGLTRDFCHSRSLDEAFEAYKRLGIYTHGAFMKAPWSRIDSLELLREFLGEILAPWSHLEISSVDHDQLNEMVAALASDQEVACASAYILFRRMLLKGALEANEYLGKFINGGVENGASDNSAIALAMLSKLQGQCPETSIHVVSEEKKCKEVPKKIGESDHTMTIFTSALVIIAQVAATVLSSGFTNSPSYPPWIRIFVVACTVAGFGLIMAGLGLRPVKPMLYGVVIRTGAMAIVLAAITSLTIPLSPVVAWIIALVAAAVVAISLAVN